MFDAVLVSSELLNDSNEKVEFTPLIVVIKEPEELSPGLVSDNLEDAVYVALPEIITADAIVTFPVEEIDVPEASNVVPIELAFVATELVPERCVIAPPENKVEGPVGVLTEFPFNVNGTEMFIPPEDVVMEPV